MKFFIDRHQQLLKALVDHDVDFLIIGGYAVIFYGYKRTTKDLDIWVKPDNKNKQNIKIALQQVGVTTESLKKIDSFDFTKDFMFRIWDPPEQVDFMTRINVRRKKNNESIFIDSQLPF